MCVCLACINFTSCIIYVTKLFQSAEYFGCCLMKQNRIVSVYFILSFALTLHSLPSCGFVWEQQPNTAAVVKVYFFVFNSFDFNTCSLCVLLTTDLKLTKNRTRPQQTRPDQVEPNYSQSPSPPPLNLLCWSDNLTPLGLDRRPRGSHHWSSKLCLAMPQVRGTIGGGEIVLSLLLICFFPLTHKPTNKKWLDFFLFLNGLNELSTKIWDKTSCEQVCKTPVDRQNRRCETRFRGLKEESDWPQCCMMSVDPASKQLLKPDGLTVSDFLSPSKKISAECQRWAGFNIFVILCGAELIAT